MSKNASHVCFLPTWKLLETKQVVEDPLYRMVMGRNTLKVEGDIE